MEKRVYKPLQNIGQEELQTVLTSGSREELALLPLRVGEYWDNWREAQTVCLKLLTHEDAMIRANAALGLAYTARTQGALDKEMVKPYLLKELRENEEYRWRIIDSIQDINSYLGWHMAEKAIEKLK